MKRAFTGERIAQLAETREFQVSKYRWSHDQQRKLCRRLAADGKLELVRQDRDNFYYRATSKRGCGKKLAKGQWYSFCGETDMGQTIPALCVECGGELKLAE